MHNQTREAGFTLIELVIVIVLMGIISVAVTKIFVQALTTINTEQQMADAAAQGQIVMQRMVRDIRMIRSASDITTMTNDNLVFTNMLGNSINYNHNGGSEILTLNGNDISTGVQYLTLGYKTAANATATSAANLAYIQIALTINLNNTNYVLNSSVYLRDLSS